MAYIGKEPNQKAVRNRFYYTATGGETSLSSTQISNFAFEDGAYVDVSMNGIALVAGTDYNTTTANTIGGLDALTADDVVEILVYEPFSVFSGNVNGDFSVNGALTVDTDTLRVDATNNRVGIGTSSPDRDLHVEQSGHAKIKVESTGTNASIEIHSDSGGDNKGHFRISGDPTSSGGLFIYDETNSAERMRINNSGNVGIGTTSINRKLDVAGAMSTDSIIFRSNNSAPSGDAGIYRAADNTIALSTGSTERMRIDSSGDVGIGDASPDRKLHVNSGATNVVAKFESTDSVAAIEFTDSAGSAEIGNSGNDLVLFPAGTERVRVKSDGKMHIGSPNSLDTRTNKIYGMKAPNILTWEDIASTTDGATVADPETNYYGVSFDPLQATNRWNYDHTPFGGEGIVWRGIANTSLTTAQGGWNTNNFTIDPSYSYVFINFVRRASSAASGSYYFGLSGGAVVNVGGSNNGANNTNPYWTVLGTSSLVRNEWYVDYRTVRSKNTSATGVPKNNGLYRMRDGARAVGPSANSADCFKWRSDASSTHHRTYLYYASANSGVTLDWYAPAVYKCDGTEPTLSEIFKLYEATD